MRLFAAAALALIATTASAEEARFSTYAKQPALRAQMLEQVKGQEAWLVSLVEQGGVEGLARTITVDGKPYTYAATCRPHMCSDYAVALLVGPEQQAYLYTFGDEVKDTLLAKDDTGSILGTFLVQTKQH